MMIRGVVGDVIMHHVANDIYEAPPFAKLVPTSSSGAHARLTKFLSPLSLELISLSLTHSLSLSHNLIAEFYARIELVLVSTI